MRISSILRRDFPRGWWHSSAWWFSGLKDVLVSCLVAMFTATFTRRVRRIVAHRDEPRTVARLVGYVEGWVVAVILGLVYLSMLVTLVAHMGAPEGVMLIMETVILVWSISNISIGSVALWVFTRSRLRWRSTWKDIDFAADHAPRYGRPPETIEEYQALQMQAKQSD